MPNLIPGIKNMGNGVISHVVSLNWVSSGKYFAGVSSLQHGGRIQPGMAVNEAQQKIVNLLKTLIFFLVSTCHNVFNVWPKKTL